MVVCANLPYNITTPVITALLQSQCFQAVTVMIQREVAKRICAQPGTAEYGAFTLLCQYYAHCEVLFDVPPSCFLPAPKVTSSVIRMTVREAPPVPVGDPALFSGWCGGLCPAKKDANQQFVILLDGFCRKRGGCPSPSGLQFDGDDSWGAPHFCRLCPINGKTPRNPGKLGIVTCIKSCKGL